MKPPELLAGRRGWLFAILVGLSLVQASGFAGTAFATRAAFGALSERESASVMILALLGGSAAIAVLAQFFLRVLAEVVGQDYAKSVRLRLFEHASASAQSHLDNRRRGYQLMRFIGDLTALKQWPGLGLPRLIQAMVILPVSTTVLFVLNPFFGWLAVGVIAVAVATIMIGRPALREAHAAQRAQRAKLAADMAERMPVAPQLHAAQRQKREADRLGRRADTLARLARQRRQVAEVLKLTPDLAAGFAAAVMLALGFHLNLSTGVIAGGLAALALTATPLRNLMSTADKAAAFQIAHERLATLLGRPITDPSKTTQQLERGLLSLDVSLPGSKPFFALPGQERILPPATLDKIEPYLTGKEPTPIGWIRVQGKDICDIAATSLGRRIAVISERPLALKGSLRRSLSLGLQRAPSDQEMLTRITKAELSDVLKSLGGLERRLAENARNLTPQERTHLAALQAAVRRPGLLLVRQGATDPAILPALAHLKSTKILAEGDWLGNLDSNQD